MKGVLEEFMNFPYTFTQSIAIEKVIFSCYYIALYIVIGWLPCEVYFGQSLPQPPLAKIFLRYYRSC